VFVCLGSQYLLSSSLPIFCGEGVNGFVASWDWQS
jgi:hypothetical protein